MSSSTSTSQSYRKRKLSSASHEDDSGQKRRNPKDNLILRLEIPTTTGTLEIASDVDSDVSGADSLFDDIFDELSEIAPNGTNTLSSLSSSRSCSQNRQYSLPSPSLASPIPAFRTLPSQPNGSPVPGLFFDPSILVSPQLASEVMDFCMRTYFSGESVNVNQVMLFGRALSSSDDVNSNINLTGLPPPLLTLLSSLSELLLPHLPPSNHSLLFPVSSTSAPTSPNLNRARQAIINLYHPGEGITPHVDLLRRFGDGIVGVSFGSGCVMEFRRVGDGEVVPESYAKPSNSTSSSQQSVEKDREVKQGDMDTDAYDLYLPERSIIVMSGDARYKWTHGIPGRKWDYVEDGSEDLDVNSSGEGVDGRKKWSRLERGTRLSITFRFLLPGAEIVGPSGESENDL